MARSNPTPKVTASAVNRIAELSATIAELGKEKDKLIAALKLAGAGTYEGATHYVRVSEYDRTTFDWEAIAKKLKPSRQLVTAYRKVKRVKSASLNGYPAKRAA